MSRDQGRDGQEMPDTPDAIDEAELPAAPHDQPARGPGRGRRLTAPLAVGLGGALGAILRYRVNLWAVGLWGDRFPWGTLLINVTGCLVIGCYLTLVTERFAGRPTTRLFVATGILGGYTTFSTFAYEAVSLIGDGRIGTAAAYVIASLALSVAGALAGVLAARAVPGWGGS